MCTYLYIVIVVEVRLRVSISSDRCYSSPNAGIDADQRFPRKDPRVNSKVLPDKAVGSFSEREDEGED